MSAVVIANAFSLNMLNLEVGITDLQVCPTSPDVIREEVRACPKGQPPYPKGRL